MMFNGYNEELVQSIKAWLREDVGSGDVTTQMTIPVGHESKGIIHAKEDGIICGIPIAELVLKLWIRRLVLQPLSKKAKL